MNKLFAVFFSFCLLSFSSISSAQSLGGGEGVRGPIQRPALTNEEIRWSTPDPYIGLFATIDVNNPRTTGGFDLRLSLPIAVARVNRFRAVALTISVEGGLLSGIGVMDYVHPWTVGHVMAHTTGTLGVRMRDGALSAGFRVGYRPWITVIEDLNRSGFLSYDAMHTLLLGFEFGVGSPDVTVAASFDAIISDFWGIPLLPIVGIGICL
jgi:hypothetical protein